MNNQIVYKFLPMGTCMVEHNSTALRQFKVGDSKFVMTNPLDRNSFDSHSCYIPKTKPFESSTKYGNENLNLYSPKIKPFEEKTLKYDFKSIQDFARPIGDYLYFNKDKVEDPNNLPDRFIQFLGKTEEGKNVNKIGYVIGYSLSEGITRPEIRAKNVDYAVSINNFSCKIYPSAISDSYSKTIIPAGTTFHCLAYRQYFDPSVFKNATSVYWHKEADSYLLYIDYHKSVENDIIKLPEYLTGKKISLVEKTPSLKLLTEQTVPSDGIALSVSEQYGYIVLKLDDIK